MVKAKAGEKSRAAQYHVHLILHRIRPGPSDRQRRGIFEEEDSFLFLILDFALTENLFFHATTYYRKILSWVGPPSNLGIPVLF